MTTSIRDTREPGPATNAGRWVPWLAFITILLDGFDTTSIGFVVPTLSREWVLAPSAFTAAFVGTSLGAVIGYMLSGVGSRRLGHRSLVLLAVLCFSVTSFATGYVSSVGQLALMRFLTGIGLGAAIPACVSLAVAHGPQHRREATTVAVTSGLAVGATLGGLGGGQLIAQWGWPSIFWVGGVLPALLWPLLWRFLPTETEPPAPAPAGTRSAADVRVLFDGALRWRTTLLWTFSFLVFTATYAMSFWIPTVLLAFGFAPSEVPLGSAALGIGGVVAALLLVPLTAWCGIRPVLVVTTCLAVVVVLALARLDMAPRGALFAVAALGACLIAGTLGQAALAVSLYSAQARTSGVGWSAALGRMGSIFGPALGGALLAAGHAPRDVLLTLCIPTVAGALVLLLLGWVQRSVAPALQGS